MVWLGSGYIWLDEGCVSMLDTRCLLLDARKMVNGYQVIRKSR